MSGYFSAENIGQGVQLAGPAEPHAFSFDAQSNAEIEKIVAKYPPGRQASGVIALLYLVQNQMRRDTGVAWIPRVAMDVVAARLEMPPIRVYEVATFYFMFNTRPIGRYHLQVCTTTPCWLRGSDEVMAACRKVAGVKGGGETSADGMFTVTEVECLGACVNAPILQIDDDFYEDVDYESAVKLLEMLRRGEALPHPGSVIGRETSAPAGGPNTLTSVTE